MVELRFKPGDVGTVADGGFDSMDKFPSGAVDPSTPADKELFFNTAENKLKRFETSVWVTIDAVDALTQIADDLLTNAKINSAAAIAKAKLGALNIVDADVDAAAAIVKSKLAALEIENADVKVDAAIAKTKLAPLDIVNADINAAAEIVKTKLAALAIVDADVDAAAAIVKSKLAALDIVDADVDAVTVTKITGAVDGRAASTTGDKGVTALGYDTGTEEVIVDREA